MYMSVIWEWGEKKLGVPVNFIYVISTFIFWFTPPSSKRFFPIASFFRESPMLLLLHHGGAHICVFKIILLSHSPKTTTLGSSKNEFYLSVCTIGKPVSISALQYYLTFVNLKKVNNNNNNIYIYICLKKHSQNWGIKWSLKWPKIGLFGFLFTWFHFCQSTKANIKIMIEVGDCQNPWEKQNHKLKTVRLPWEDHCETQWNWVCHLISQYHFYVGKSKGRTYPKQPHDSSEVKRTKISHFPTE